MDPRDGIVLYTELDDHCDKLLSQRSSVAGIVNLVDRRRHGRPHIGDNGVPPPRKMDEKLKSENMQKEQFSEWG